MKWRIFIYTVLVLSLFVGPALAGGGGGYDDDYGSGCGCQMAGSR